MHFAIYFNYMRLVVDERHVGWSGIEGSDITVLPAESAEEAEADHVNRRYFDWATLLGD